MPKPTENTNPLFRREWLEENMEELYEEAPCGYLSTLPDGTIFKVNNTFLEWLGYNKEELIGKKKLQQLFSIGGQIFYETHHSPLLNMQGFVKELNYEITTKAGSRLPVLVNAVQKKDSNGHALFNRITVFDFSDRKKYELELMLQKQKAEAATEAKEAFLSTVTHEIRTPIHAILGASDLLRKNTPRPDQKELLDALQFSTENLLQLINDLLDISKLNSGLVTLEEKPFNLSELAKNLVLIFEPSAHKKGLKLQLEVDNDLSGYFIGDSLKIGRVLTNLLGNALKFTESGQISLIVEKDILEGGKKGIRFTVNDTGIGIPANKLEAIFQAFTQANDAVHDQYGGSGLGLSICQRLLAMYGSRLEVTSTVGKGSTFRFTLLLSPYPHTLPKEGVVIEEQKPLQNCKVLLVEDNASNILITSRYFKLWSVDFDIARNGEEAIKKVQENNFDLVLMDLNMPMMDGFEATQRIRQLPNDKFRKIPIIALSASPIEVVARKIEKAGINGFISKPFHPSELYGAIKIQSVIPKHSKTRSARKDLLEMSEIREIFENDDEDMREYFKALMEDLEDARKEFLLAADNADLQRFKGVVHKTKSFVRIFKPRGYEEAIKTGRLAYERGEAGSIGAATAEILSEIEQVKSFLQEQI